MKRCANKKCPMPNPQKRGSFNKASQNKDGLQLYCRVCQSQSNGSLANRARQAERQKESRRRNPSLFNAYRRVRYQLSTGKLTRGPCQTCGATEHIRCYLDQPRSKPQWYCQAHHPRASGPHREHDDE